MIRSLLLSSAVSIMALASAFAADLPNTKGGLVYTPPPLPTWTGFYIGINAGYGGNQFVYPFDGEAGGERFSVGGNGNANITSSGFLVGGQIGYNYQFVDSNFVLGGEADIDWSSVRGRLGAELNAGDSRGDSFNAGGYAGSHLEYLGTVRARLGYAWGNLLPYVTGGFAYGQTSSYYNIGYNLTLVNGGSFGGSIANSAQHFQTGWTIGAGLEYQITQNLSFKTEYLYASLGAKTLYAISGGTGAFGYDFNLRERTSVNIVRAGLNWRFDWFAPPVPVVAKY
jgi:outer membrane immunogenic protein